MSYFSQQPNNIQFSVKAGRTEFLPSTDNKVIVRSVPVKGLLYIATSEKDKSIYKLAWRNRETQKIDWSIQMVNDHRCYAVESGNKDDRIICYQTPDNHYVFWIQDPSANVAEVVTLIRALIKKAVKKIAANEVQRALRELGVKVPPPQPQGQQNNNPLLQQTIPGLTGNAAELFQQSAEYRYEALQREMQMSAPPLTSVLTKENISPLLEDFDILARLLPLLPEGQQTKEQLLQQLSCPQFRQCLNKITYGLDYISFYAFVTQYGYDAEPGTEALGTLNITKALIDILKEQVKKERVEEEKKD